MGELLTKGIIFALIIFAWNYWQDTKNEYPVPPATAVSATAVNSTAPVTGTNQYTNIENTIRIIAPKFDKIDVNGDGLYNCIDTAVLFYQYFPD